jgi:hypothetical protein
MIVPQALAVLHALDGSTRVIAVPEYPPPEYYVPRPVKFSATPDEAPPAYTRPNHRMFRLSNLRDGHHKWMRVYNEGRSQTPESAYVYFEKAQASPPGKEG